MTLEVMSVWLWSFLNDGSKWVNFWRKNKHSQMKLLNLTSYKRSLKVFPNNFWVGFSILVHCDLCIHKLFHHYYFFTGFVAHHYNENIGIILTVKGEIVIFEKSVVFKQEGYHDWCKIDQVQQLTVGSYVKLRKHPSNVAEKVWSCHDFGTLEPSRPASTNVKGNFEFNSSFFNR